MQLKWVLKNFDELTTIELYSILQLRNEVFVVEQNCPYQDADNKDQQSYHFCGWDGTILVAYTRIIPPGIAFTESSIGRVVSSPQFRKTGAGRLLMQKSIDTIFTQFNWPVIKIGAQVYLEQFYKSLGFVETIPQKHYLEDGIPHMEMLITK